MKTPRAVPLRVYICNCDGVHSSLVAAHNKREAARLLHMPLGGLNRYGHEITHHRAPRASEACALALSRPGVVFRQKIVYADADSRVWVEAYPARTL